MIIFKHFQITSTFWVSRLDVSEHVDLQVMVSSLQIM